MESKRRVRTLFAAWIAYWTVLGITTLTPAVLAIWRATHAPQDQGSVGANYSDGAFTLTVSTFGRQTYVGSIHLLALALWVAGPPLLAWLAWVFLSRERQRSRENVSG